MLGAIVGDIVGSRFEFDNYRKKDFELFTDRSFVTDDTIMSISIGKAIMETEKENTEKTDAYYELLEKNTIRYMRKIGKIYPNCGYGGRFFHWMFSDDPKPYNSFGNGAAMRVSPVAWVAKDENEVKMLSKTVTAITHNHPEGIKGAEATALAIFMAKKGFSKQEISLRIQQDYYDLGFTIDEIRNTYEYNETCQGTVPQALQAFLESTSFEDAIRNAISLGGDSDTMGAIAGSVAEAYYGVPKNIEAKAMRYLDDHLKPMYGQWKAFLEKKE